MWIHHKTPEKDWDLNETDFVLFGFLTPVKKTVHLKGATNSETAGTAA